MIGIFVFQENLSPEALLTLNTEISSLIRNENFYHKFHRFCENEFVYEMKPKMLKY